MMVWAIIAVVIVILIIMVINIYNNYVKLDLENHEAFSNIGVFLQKRLDLIPNLVNTVKGYTKHELETLTKVVEARSQLAKLDLTDINNVEQIQKAQNILSQSLRSLFAVSEQYPELKANTNFLELQKELKNMESELEAARRYYNATCAKLNEFVRVFPNNIFSKMFGFRQAKMFTEESEAQKAVKVEF